MKKISIIYLLLLILYSNAESQALNERLYHAYITGDMSDWPSVMDEMKDIWEVTGSIDILYELTIAQYGYIGFCLQKEDKKMAREVLSLAEHNMKVLLDHDPAWASVHAIKGALYGVKVILDPYKAVVFGRKAFTQNQKALDLGPEDPNVWMEKGNLELYKPEIFNKNVRLAVDAYTKALRLFEENEMLTKSNWLYLNTMFSLAEAYEEADMYSEADAMYQKILKVEPGIIWLKEKTYPKFRERYKKVMS